ncbi:MAG: dioxygenase [Chloroflexota bacterium]|nr:dioxygenase [Chloroflexota bacterium]
MATGKSPKDRAAREERERSRLYRARNEFHTSVVRRRVRDNVIAGVGGGLLVAAVLGGQIAYYAAGPGAPQPEPTATTEPTQAPTPTAPPSPAPTPSASPTP